MKRLLLLISFAIIFLNSFTQTDVHRDNRVSSILKQALASKSGYYIYGRTGAAGFINIAVLNQSSHTMTWFTCHGRLFDSTKLIVQEFEQVTSKQLDPFVLYQNICDKYLTDIAAAKDIYRVYGDIQLLDKLNGNYRALFVMETVQAAKTPLQKLIAIENVRKKILIQLVYLNCVNPSQLHDDPLYKNSKEQAGAMIQTKDSTVYYNIDPTSAVAKIILYKKSAGQLYIQSRFSEIIDSVAIQPEKFDLLQKEKTDVFLLYRGWLEMQWQGALSAIRRQSTELYNQVNAQNEKEVKELYIQLNAIGEKINQLNAPEAKSIEQAVFDTYKNETSEINYIPLLGIGYSLTQTRGQKEYELTNHLGNVLVTVSDKKIGVSSSSNSSLIDHYEPDIISAQDYYPFGMLQPGRSYLSPNGDKYRYGFNGKENDNEVKGEGNQQDYGMRVYDPRLGRFLSVDPLMKDYPELTPYQFSSNSPLENVDLDGLEKASATGAIFKSIFGSPSGYSNPRTPLDHITNSELRFYTYKGFANAVFQSVFKETLPRKFISNYTYGYGKPYKLTDQEAKDLHVAATGLHGVREDDTKKANDFLATIKPNGGGRLPEGYHISGGALTGGTLGRFTIYLEGIVIKDSKGDWTFEGRMKFYDIYDFHTKPPKPGDLKRSSWGDFQTDFADRYLPGVPFVVTSDWIPIKQTTKGKEASDVFDWFKGQNGEAPQNEISNQPEAAKVIQKSGQELK